MKRYRATAGGETSPSLVDSADLDAAMAALEEASAETPSGEPLSDAGTEDSTVPA
jgi:hypothetical protein